MSVPHTKWINLVELLISNDINDRGKGFRILISGVMSVLIWGREKTSTTSVIMVIQIKIGTQDLMNMKHGFY